jgi:hypothetical protein
LPLLVVVRVLVVALTDEEPVSTREESSTLVSVAPAPGRLERDEALTLVRWRTRVPPFGSVHPRRQIAVACSRKVLSAPPLD